MSLNSPSRIPEKYGLLIAAGLIAFFLVMKLIGLGHMTELRLLNLLILAVGIFLALKKFKQTHHARLNYFRGLVTGVATGGVASLLFGVFLFVYMKLDEGLMRTIVESEPMGRYLNPYIVAFIVVLEGFFSGLTVTFVILNWVATDEVSGPVDSDEADLESTPGGR
jgi:putative effector of murein hydrolase